MNRILFAGLAMASVCFSGCEPPEAGAQTSSLVVPSIVIAIVHSGGGNAGAVYDRDYVVLVNRADVPFATTELSLQYGSGSGTTALGATESTRTELPDRTLAPGQAMLVPGAFGSGAGAALPASDVDDATPIAMATSGGRLALVRGAASLGCNGGSLPCDAAALDRVIDRVAWGSAVFAETSPVAAPSNAQALVRASSGCTDSDDNAADFAREAPTTRSFADAPIRCVDPADAGIVVADASVDAGGVIDASLGLHPSDVQGAAYLSPLTGTIVSDLRGVVTYVESRRFAIEAPGDPLASNAVFVKTSGAPPVAVGSLVSVDGVVREERPGCASCPGGDSRLLSTTTVEASRIVQLGRAELPPATRIDASFPESYATTRPDLDREASLRPESDALDRLERLEARRVELVDAVVVSPTRIRSDGRRTLAVLPSLGRDRRTSALLLPAAADGTFGDAFVLVDTATAPLPMLHVGDSFEGTSIGVVDTEQGRPVVRVVAWRGARHREVAPTNRPSPEADSTTVASFNAHGLSAVDDASRFAAIARVLVESLGGPDLVVLEEISDDSGSTNDGTVTARETLARLEDAIAAASGPRYASHSVDPVDGEDGGAPGANIRPVLLVRSDRGIVVEARAGDPVGVALDDRGHVSPNPARLGVDESAFVDSRKPLVVELSTEDESFVLIGVHLRSHLGDGPRLGRIQPPDRPNESRRLEQVVAIATFVDRLERSRRGRPVIVAGDFNDGPDAVSLVPLVERGVLPARLDRPDDGATFLYEGLVTSFDRVHLSPSLAPRVRSSQVVHVAATRADGVSDHDPIVVELGPRAAEPRASGCSFASGRAGARGGLRCTAILAAILLGLRRSRRCP